MYLIYVQIYKTLLFEGRFMYHIHKDSQDLYKKDGSSHQIFLLTAVDSDEENDETRKLLR